METSSPRFSPIEVPMGDGTTHPIRHLLTGGTANHKGELTVRRWPAADIVFLTLAPNVTAGGPTVCPCASKWCIALCLAHAGRGQLAAVRRARTARTRLFWADPRAFLARLHDDLDWAEWLARRRGHRLFARLNALSDLEWERMDPSLFSEHPSTMFFDYSRITEPDLPPNLDLTFSYSGENRQACRALLASRAARVAVVFKRRPFPRTFWGAPVLGGDEHDLRPFDAKGVVIGLTAKGRAGRNPFVIGS